MHEGPDIARIASLVGDPARANMLTALVGGTALTATELAMEAGVSLSTASSHLSKLTSGGLLTLLGAGTPPLLRTGRAADRGDDRDDHGGRRRPTNRSGCAPVPATRRCARRASATITLRATSPSPCSTAFWPMACWR